MVVHTEVLTDSQICNTDFQSAVGSALTEKVIIINNQYVDTISNFILMVTICKDTSLGITGRAELNRSESS